MKRCREKKRAGARVFPLEIRGQLSKMESKTVKREKLEGGRCEFAEINDDLGQTSKKDCGQPEKIAGGSRRGEGSKCRDVPEGRKKNIKEHKEGRVNQFKKT